MVSPFLCNIDNQEHAGRWLRKQPNRECEAPHGLEWNRFRHVVPGLGSMGVQCSAPGNIEK